MEKKNLAVEWLQEALTRYMGDVIHLPKHLFEEAKKIEEENIKISFVEGADIGEMFNNENRAFPSDADLYFNREFKSK